VLGVRSLSTGVMSPYDESAGCLTGVYCSGKKRVEEL